MDMNAFWNDSESEGDSGRGSNWSETLSDLTNDSVQQMPSAAENGPEQLALLCNDRIYNLVPDGDYDHIEAELEKCTLTIDLSEVDDEEANLNPAPALRDPETIDQVAEEAEEAEPAPADTEPPVSLHMIQPSYTVVYTLCKSVYDNNNKLVSSKIAHTEAYPCYNLPDDDNNGAENGVNGGFECIFSDDDFDANNYYDGNGGYDANNEYNVNDDANGNDDTNFNGFADVNDNAGINGETDANAYGTGNINLNDIDGIYADNDIGDVYEDDDDDFIERTPFKRRRLDSHP
ncbi:uncharacterized protein LOC116804457 [Drosophila mojavensis]|uniref:uncharacterized protein LOC116804457 n=1 Tax=Drosophila mojavensis TaxID=7230 RepID=UPI001CD06229|nr:uncharacterized protein LOC116804457 [Drosophila mojavensis]